MKSRLLSLIVFVVVSVGLTAQEQVPDFRKLHYLSAEEMLLPLNTARDFIETDPPSDAVRNVGEFEQMQSVLVRYPFGVPISLIKEMAEATEVITLVGSASEQTTVTNIYTSNGVNMDNTAFLIAPTESYWVRDYGPWFVFDGEGNPGIMDFPYNRPRPNDNNVPAAVAQYLGIDLYGMNVYHTGGNYMNDGLGQAASTDLVYEENPSQTEAEIDQKFKDYLNIDHHHVRPDPLDDYIKHIDCWGKFLSPSKVIIGQVPTTDYRYDEFEAAADYFANYTSSYGVPFEVFRVYTPGTYPNTPYSNSLILNKKVFVPLTGGPYDTDAIASYEAAMPGYEIVGVEYDGWLNTDALHCRTRGVADIGMLYIKHMPILGEVAASSNYELTAEIDVNSGEAIYNDSVLVYYSVNEGDFQNINMTNTEANTWTASISGLNPGDDVDYYLYAADESGRQNSHPYIGQADPHEFTVAGGMADQLVMNPDTVKFLTVDEALEGKRLNIINVSTENVEITDITEMGDGIFMWNVVNLPAMPYSLAADDTLKLNITCGVVVAQMGALVIDTMFITTAAKTYNQILAVDYDVISNINKNTFSSFDVFPNPFTTSVNFRFDAENNELIKMRVFNISGQIVFEKQIMSVEGLNTISWDGTSQFGAKMPEGIYFFEMGVGSKTKNGKVVLNY
jgi:agmatine/peptidylarginine deiminase